MFRFESSWCKEQSASLILTYEGGTCVSEQAVYTHAGDKKKDLYLLISVGLSYPSGAGSDNDSSSDVEEYKTLFSFNDEPCWFVLP